MLQMSHLILLVLRVLWSIVSVYKLHTDHITLKHMARTPSVLKHWKASSFLMGQLSSQPIYHSLRIVHCAGARPPEPHPLLSGVNTQINRYGSQYASLITSIIYLPVHLFTSLPAVLSISLCAKVLI